jgi:hypothetical protein
MVGCGLNLLIAAALVLARLMGSTIVAGVPLPPGAGPVAVPLRQASINVTRGGSG